METIILIVHVLLAAALIGLILLQQGKGAEAGASFGGGASQTVFGSSGSSNFLGRVTAWMAAGLFITRFALAYYAKHQASAIAVEQPTIFESEEVSELPALDTLIETPTDTDVPVVN